MILNVKKLDSRAVLPTRAYEDDLGIDLYALEDTRLEANTVTKVRTGIAIQFPKWVGGVIKDRSSIATKRNMFVKAGVIDPQYTGEIIVAFHYIGQSFVAGSDIHISNHNLIKAGEKIAQMILVKSMPVEIAEVSDLSETDRGNKGFGSSDEQHDPAFTPWGV